MSEEKHFYGGQAVLEGVMMRSKTEYATAVRRLDGSVVVGMRQLSTWSQRFRWARLPFIRGNVAMVDSLTMGLESLTFSGNVALEDEAQHLEPDHALSDAEKQTHAVAAVEAKESSLGEKALWLTMIPAFALGIGLFVLLPAWAVDWILGTAQASVTEDFGTVLARNLLEGGLRLLAIVGYILAISLMPYVRRVFEYHGAEHATINAFEDTGKVDVQSALTHSPLHPRCGTAFLLVVILVKIIVGCFLGWPELWLRLILRLAVLPPIAGIAYEIIYLAGRHRGGLLEKVLAGPGLLMQKLTTRHADREQVEIAVYALAAVAPEVELPEGLPQPEMVCVGRGGEIIRRPGTARAAGSANCPDVAEL
ncbi:MAG TPA: DUF1385 domain-containing protein [Armatimonadetes bacterium]|nr:DUF1385 domain-containing protein [Armatimonadota bacterium]